MPGQAAARPESGAARPRRLTYQTQSLGSLEAAARSAPTDVGILYCLAKAKVGLCMQCACASGEAGGGCRQLLMGRSQAGCGSELQVRRHSAGPGVLQAEAGQLHAAQQSARLALQLVLQEALPGGEPAGAGPCTH